MSNGQSGPPDKLVPYSLGSAVTATERANAVSDLIAAFQVQYHVYPSIILLDSLVNAVYLGTYSTNEGNS